MEGRGGGGGAIFREHENRTLAPCAVPSIYMIYVYTAVSRARVPRARVCVHAHARLHGRYTHTHARMGAHARATSAVTRATRSSRRKLPPSLSLSPTPSLPSLFPEGQICIHTTSHTTRFNISGHGWKLSPETQADVPRGTIGLANAAIFAIAPVSGVSRRKRDC